MKSLHQILSALLLCLVTSRAHAGDASHEFLQALCDSYCRATSDCSLEFDVYTAKGDPAAGAVDYELWYGGVHAIAGQWGVIRIERASFQTTSREHPRLVLLFDRLHDRLVTFRKTRDIWKGVATRYDNPITVSSPQVFLGFYEDISFSQIVQHGRRLINSEADRELRVAGIEPSSVRAPIVYAADMESLHGWGGEYHLAIVFECAPELNVRPRFVLIYWRHKPSARGTGARTLVYEFITLSSHTRSSWLPTLGRAYRLGSPMFSEVRIRKGSFAFPHSPDLEGLISKRAFGTCEISDRTTLETRLLGKTSASSLSQEDIDRVLSVLRRPPPTPPTSVWRSVSRSIAAFVLAAFLAMAFVSALHLMKRWSMAGILLCACAAGASASDTEPHSNCGANATYCLLQILTPGSTPTLATVAKRIPTDTAGASSLLSITEALRSFGVNARAIQMAPGERQPLYSLAVVHVSAGPDRPGHWVCALFGGPADDGALIVDPPRSPFSMPMDRLLEASHGYMVLVDRKPGTSFLGFLVPGFIGVLTGLAYMTFRHRRDSTRSGRVDLAGRQ